MHNLIKQMERMSFKVINYKKGTIEVGENKAFKMPISFFFLMIEKITLIAVASWFYRHVTS